jgi:hypothetical protein
MALDGIIGYFHTWTDLPPRKALPVSIEYEYGWAPRGDFDPSKQRKISWTLPGIEP